jgi:hypothetical protein
MDCFAALAMTPLKNAMAHQGCFKTRHKWPAAGSQPRF